MTDRGPDATGTYVSPWLMLGHTRLSILDLDERSNQPFISEDGRYVLSYNGEVYNYIELREELERDHGWCFRTGGDTEVVLAGLICWGAEALGRFNGMWAFCFADTQARTGLLARDRFGVKPLYWARDHDGAVAFASRVPALACLLNRSLNPNLAHLAGYLLSSYTNFGTTTFYDGVNELEPGHYLAFSGSRVVSHRYWPSDRSPDFAGGSEAEVAALVRSAVELRLRSDVPVAVTLSGGLDSSIVTALAAKSGATIVAFTADTLSHHQNEADSAAAFCSALGVEHHRIRIDNNHLGIDQLDRLIALSDGPLASPSAVALDKIMRAVRDAGFRVVLEGQGADEVFGGYVNQLVPRICLQLVTQGRGRLAVRMWREMSEAHGFAWSATASIRELIPHAHALYTRLEGLAPALGSSLSDAAGSGAMPIRTTSMSAREVLDSQLGVGLRGLLTYGDRMSMANSVESRQPFLDYRLVEHLTTWEPAEMLGSGTGKGILRGIGRAVLPIDAPLNAPKLGFVMPVRQWMRQRDVRDRLLGGSCVSDALYDRRGVEDLLRRNARKDSAHVAATCFRLLMGELWYGQSF